MRHGISLLIIGTLLIIATLSSAAPAGIASAQSGGILSITSQQTAWGPVLVTGNGAALYMLSYDTVGTAQSPARSSCTGRCATAWPPLLESGFGGPINVSGGVVASALGTIVRPEGTLQVTYFGHPLYMFVNDKSPGQTTGENVGAFNGIWNLVSPSGKPAVGAATVSLETTTFGSVLSASTAFNTYRSLYLLTGDGPGSTVCADSCARFWPPLLTSGAPIAGAGVNPNGLGTLQRPDGTTQVTYFGWPVYYFAFDLSAGAKSGLTNGQDFVDPTFGVWYLIAPSGHASPGLANVSTASTNVGTVIAYNPTGDPKGSAYPVYTFSVDTMTSSACTGSCQRVWAPVLTNSAPKVVSGSSAQQAMLGTITRTDGTTQVTYNGHPLYLFTPDFSGTSGQGITAYGGQFMLLQPTGSTNTTLPSTRTTAALPDLTSSAEGKSASFVVSFTSSHGGTGMVLFGSGPGCSGLVEVGTQDQGAGTTTHNVKVTGNDMPGTVGDNGIQPGATYWYETVTMGASGTQTDDNAGACYSVTIPSS